MTFSFEFSPGMSQWREEVSRFLDDNLTPELQQEMREVGSAPPMRGPLQWDFRQRVAEAGWLGVALPTEYGGLGMSLLHEWVMLEEFAYRGAPPFDLTETTLAHVLMRVGTEENRQSWLPRIVKNEVRFVLGQSEPDAGVDLSRIETRAELAGGDYTINGQKIWNSMAHSATHQWLAARTSGRAPDRRGISIIIVPMQQPGITIQTLWGWDGSRTNQTFFDDVRASSSDVIGEVGEGFTYAQEVLELEGVKGPRIGGMQRLFEGLVSHCGEHEIDGRPIIEHEHAHMALAELDVSLETLRLLSLRATLTDMSNGSADVERAELKVRLAEMMARLADGGMAVLGEAALLDRHSDAAPLGGALEELFRQAPLRGFAGGAVEIMRDIIAQRGYGLPGLQARDEAS